MSTDSDPRYTIFVSYVDHMAQVNPDAIYAGFPNHPLNYDLGFRKITYRDLANAINGLARWMIDTLGAGQDEVLAYFGPTDVRYPALVFAAHKAGYCMYMPSPRNSSAAHRSLLQTLECTKLLATTPRPPPMAGIIAAATVSVYELPSVDELLKTAHPHVPFTKTYAEAASERCVIVHTSGSTGIPKPIIWTHETGIRYLRAASLEAPEGYISQESWLAGKRQFLCLPPFHAGGLASLTFIALSAQITNICAISGVPTAAGMIAALKQTPFDTALVPPSVVLELAQNPELLEYASQHLKYLAYCGGNLPQAVGETIAAHIPLINAYGASEMGLLHLIHSKEHRDSLKDWGYIQVHPGVGVEFRPVTETESELVLVRSPEVEENQLPFTIFPDIQEYHSKDLFVRHPDSAKADFWRWSARLDDIITFLNGEKTNPVSMEQHILATNPEVSGVVVAGSQRFQASLLVELANSSELSPSERAGAIERLWPSIEEANSEAPAHARIAKTHIMFTTHDRPLPRAGKGTVQRPAALALYAIELDALYADADKLSIRDTTMARSSRVQDATMFIKIIEQTVLDVTGWSPDQLNTESFFHSGMDSLQVLTLARALRDGLQMPEVIPNLIYLHPSVPQLSQAILDLIRATQSTKDNTLMNQRETLLRELQTKLPIQPAHILPQSDEKAHTVILTGSTGTLGTYILAALLQNPNIEHIHCLNRNPNSITQQQKKAHKFYLNLPLERVSFHTADLTQPNLGLTTSVLQTLQNTTTLTIHAAWPVNWTAPLHFFKPILVSTINLLNFCARATHSPRFLFLSTIGSVTGTTNVPIPEEIIQTTTPAATGYFNSKYIAEQLIHHAAQTGALRHAAVVRVGQVAGAVRAPGQWNPAEWFPSLVQSSAHLKALPQELGLPLGAVDWVPVDLLAEVLVELALPTPILTEETENTKKMEVEVYHPHNLHTAPWSAIRPIVADALGGVQTIPLGEWVQRVRDDIEAASHQGVEVLQNRWVKNPAARLIDFWEGVLTSSSGDEHKGGFFDTAQTAERSPLLRKVEGIKATWVQKWMREWNVI